MANTTFVRALKVKLREFQKKESEARAAIDEAQNRYAQIRDQIKALHIVIGMESPEPKVRRNRKPLSIPTETKDGVGRRAPVQDALLKILLSEKTPLRVKVILSKLQEQKVSHSPTSIPTMLRRLERRGVVRRIGYGRYQGVQNINTGEKKNVFPKV